MNANFFLNYKNYYLLRLWFLCILISLYKQQITNEITSQLTSSTVPFLPAESPIGSGHSEPFNLPSCNHIIRCHITSNSRWIADCLGLDPSWLWNRWLEWSKWYVRRDDRFEDCLNRETVRSYRLLLPMFHDVQNWTMFLRTSLPNYELWINYELIIMN